MILYSYIIYVHTLRRFCRAAIQIKLVLRNLFVTIFYIILS